MSENNIDNESKNHESISLKMESVSLNSIRKILTDEDIQHACDDVNYKYRRRVITPIITILHMVLSAIWPEESFAASWQVLWTSFSSRFSNDAGKSPSLGSVAKARQRLPVELWRNLFESISRQSQKYSQSFDKRKPAGSA